MSEEKASKPGKHISDVAHPNQTASEPSSKSIIVTNRPIIKDPMMVHEGKAEESADVVEAENQQLETTAKSELKIVITPDPESDAEPEPEAEPKAEADEPKPDAETAKPAIEEAKPDTDEKPEIEVPKPTIDVKTEPKPEPEAKPGHKPGDAEPNKLHDDTPAKEGDEGTTPKGAGDTEEIDAEATKLAEHDAAIQKLVETKQYFLPINAVEKRRSKRFVLLGVVLSVLLALAWADIALDAGLIQIGNVKPVTHFFSN